MELTVKIELGDQTMQAIISALQADERVLRRLDCKLDQLLGSEQEQSTDLSALIDAVQNSSGIDHSILTLVQGIADELDSRPGLSALSQKIRASADALKAAVAANSST